jgi:hypothetical protein
VAAAESNAVATATDDGRIECALGETAAFTNSCALERTETTAGPIITVRQPDGGFHRLRKVDDGRGVIAADGSEPAKVAVLDDSSIEVAIGGARYRLPARVGSLSKP